MFNLFWRPRYSKLQQNCLIWILVQTVYLTVTVIMPNLNTIRSLRELKNMVGPFILVILYIFLLFLYLTCVQILHLSVKSPPQAIPIMDVSGNSRGSCLYMENRYHPREEKDLDPCMKLRGHKLTGYNNMSLLLNQLDVKHVGIK